MTRSWQYQQTIRCPKDADMQSLGATLAACLPTNSLITLQGELGAGKSVLARSVIHALGYQGRVKSPTYTLLESYHIESPNSTIDKVAHLDLYRLSDPQELHYIGFDEVVEQHHLIMIEWSQRAGNLLPPVTLAITIDYVSENNAHNARDVLLQSNIDLEM